jgi:hypothetical protein
MFSYMFAYKYILYIYFSYVPDLCGGRGVFECENIGEFPVICLVGFLSLNPGDGWGPYVAKSHAERKES